MNELIFIVHTIIIALFALGSLALGQGALVAFVCAQCILANLFVVKQITLFGFNATCADAFTVGATIGLNLLQEYFGKEIAKKTIWINFFLLIFYAIVSQIHLIYIPHTVDTMHLHFMPLLNLMPRIVIASFTVYWISQMADYYLYGFLKKMFHDRYIIARNYASIVLCQLLDTILFSFLGLYGIVDNVWEVIIISYLIKLASIIVATPFVGLSRKIYNITMPTSSNIKQLIIIFALIITSNNCVCMEQEDKDFTHFLTHEANYKVLEIALKKYIKTQNGIEYNSLPRNGQYEMLKTYIKHNKMDYLSLCLENKFNPNRYRKNVSLLHCAVQYHRPQAIKILAQYNPDLIPLNEQEQTPLDYAVYLNCKKCTLAMAEAIGKKHNELHEYQKHCGLTKHILKSGHCKECVDKLGDQLTYHKLDQYLFSKKQRQVLALINH